MAFTQYNCLYVQFSSRVAVKISDMDKEAVSFVRISSAIKGFDFPKVDLVVGIGSGGTVPAGLVAFLLGIPLHVVSVNYRDNNNKPVRDNPVFLDPFALNVPEGSSILLVDDVAVTGKTMDLVREALQNYTIHTFVLKGKADFVLFPDIRTCVLWPWHTHSNSMLYAD